jgi:hypothetical protein
MDRFDLRITKNSHAPVLILDKRPRRSRERGSQPARAVRLCCKGKALVAANRSVVPQDVVPLG